MKMITVLVYRVGKKPQLVGIEGNLESMQRIVGGYIEEISFGDGLLLICNEDGKRDCAPNRSVPRLGVIHGSFLVCRYGEDGGTESLRPSDELRCQELIS